MRDLAAGGFIAQQRNVVLVGGTGTGKTHPRHRHCAEAASAPDHEGAFYTTVDLVNQLEAQARAGRQGRLADYLTRLDFVILDELGYLPFAQAGGHLLFHLISRLYERTSLILVYDQPRLRRMAERVRRDPKMTTALRSIVLLSPLRHRRDRQQPKLALQKPRLTNVQRLCASPIRPRPGCATLTSFAGASAAVSGRHETGQFWTPIRGQCSTPIDTQASWRHDDDPLGGILRGPFRGLRLQPFLRSAAWIRTAADPGDASAPRRRGEGVRRLFGQTDRDHRSVDGRNPRGGDFCRRCSAP